MSVIEDIHVLLKTGCYSFTSIFSRYSTFSVILLDCFSCISTFSPWEISLLFIRCVTKLLYNQVCLKKLTKLLMLRDRWCFIFRLTLVIIKIKQSNYLRSFKTRDVSRGALLPVNRYGIPNSYPKLIKD